MYINTHIYKISQYKKMDITLNVINKIIIFKKKKKKKKIIKKNI